jgi:hypothetical protein
MKPRHPIQIIEDLLKFVGIHEGAYDDHAEEIQALEAEAREEIRMHHELMSSYPAIFDNEVLD